MPADSILRPAQQRHSHQQNRLPPVMHVTERRFSFAERPRSPSSQSGACPLRRRLEHRREPRLDTELLLQHRQHTQPHRHRGALRRHRVHSKCRCYSPRSSSSPVLCFGLLIKKFEPIRRRFRHQTFRMFQDRRTSAVAVRRVPAWRARPQSALMATTLGVFWLISRSRIRAPTAGVISSMPRCA